MLKKHKCRPFKTKNNTETLCKQLLNNFEKVQKTTFLTLKIAKNGNKWHSQMSKVCQILLEISIYEIIYQLLELKIHSKFSLWRFKRMAKQFQNNYEKVQNTTFLTRKIAKTRVSILTNRSIFGSIFDLRALILLC